MSNLSISFFSKLLPLMALALLGTDSPPMDIEDSWLSDNEADSFYQIVLEEKFPGSPDGYRELQVLTAKAAYRKISLEEFEAELKKNKKKNAKIINFDPKQGSLLLIGMMSHLSHGSRNDGIREIIHLLLKYGADPNKRNASPFRQAAVHYIVITNDLKICRTLMKHGADPSILDIAGRTALEVAKGTLPNSREVYDCLKKGK